MDLDYAAYDQSFHTTKRRLIRSIEIIHPDNKNKDNKLIDRVIEDVLVIGLNVKRENLLENIKKRLYERLENGLIDEVKLLIKKGMTLERLSYFGLDRAFFKQFIQKNEIRGIDRIVPIGRSMEMSYLWDGYNLLRALTRIIDIK